MYHLFCHKLSCLYQLSHRAHHPENQTTKKNSQTAWPKKKKRMCNTPVKMSPKLKQTNQPLTEVMQNVIGKVPSRYKYYIYLYVYIMNMCVQYIFIHINKKNDIDVNTRQKG